MYRVAIIIGLFVLVSSKMDFKICRKKSGVFPIPGTLCRGYYKCVNFSPIELVCPNNQLFNTIKEQCVEKDRFLCLENTKSAFCPTKDGFFLKPGTGCKIYYDCCNGKSKEKECPLNQLFDPSARKCKWSFHYSCIESISSEASTKDTFSTTSIIFASSTTDSDRNTDITASSTVRMTSSTPATSELSTEEIVSESSTEEMASSTPTKSEPTTRKIVSELSTEPISTIATSDSSSEDIASESPTEESSTPATSESPTQEIASSTPGKSEPPTLETVSEMSTEETFTTVTSQSSTMEIVSESSTVGMESSTPATSESPTQKIESSTPGKSEQPTLETVSEMSTEETFTTVTGQSSTMEIVSESSTVEMVSSTPATSESPTQEIVTEQSTGESSTPVIPSELSTDKTIYSTLISRQTWTEGKVSSTESIREILTKDMESSTFSSIATKNDESSVSLEATRETKITFSTNYPEVSTPDETNIFCPEPFGYFPHPTDKHKFVGCVNNVPSILTCPSNLVYNQERKQCVYSYEMEQVD